MSEYTTERVEKQVIEKKLLAALDDATKVAALFDAQDLRDLHAALCGYVLGERDQDKLTWEAYMQRRKKLAEGVKELAREAFGMRL